MRKHTSEMSPALVFPSDQPTSRLSSPNTYKTQGESGTFILEEEATTLYLERKRREDFWMNLAIILTLAFFCAILTYLVLNMSQKLRGYEDGFLTMKEQVVDLDNQVKTLEAKLEGFTSGQRVVKNLGGYTWESFTGAIKNEEGDTELGVEIDVLSDEYRWPCGDVNTIVDDTTPIDFGAVVSGYNNDKQLKHAKAILCLGTASSAGQLITEEKRAGKRVSTLINLVKANLSSSDLPIGGMNLGKYMEGNPDQTACSAATMNQRRVVLIKIMELKPFLSDRELNDYLTQILIDKAVGVYDFPVDIREYSKYQRNQLMFIPGR